jgi:hypothetical protein
MTEHGNLRAAGGYQLINGAQTRTPKIKTPHRSVCANNLS